MKPYALHVPLTERQRKALLKGAKNAGLTQGQYARKLMYGKLSGEEIMQRADTSDGTEVSVRWPGQRKAVTLKNSKAKPKAVVGQRWESSRGKVREIVDIEKRWNGYNWVLMCKTDDPKHGWCAVDVFVERCTLLSDLAGTYPWP